MSALLELTEERDELTERIAAVDRLHVRADCCDGQHEHLCIECWNAYPCPTRRALDGHR